MGGTTIFDPAWIVAALAAAYAIYKTVIQGGTASGSEPKPAPPSPPPPPPPVIQDLETPAALALMEATDRIAQIKAADLIQAKLADYKAQRWIDELNRAFGPETKP